MYSKVVEDPYKSATENPTKSLTGSVNVYFPAIRDWIKSHVENYQVLIKYNIASYTGVPGYINNICCLKFC